MPLPAAAQRKVDEAAALMRSATPAAADLAKAQQDLVAAQAALAKAKTDLEPAERRYAVLKGKYDKEVPELNAKVRALEAQVKGLTDATKAVKPGEVTSLSAEERELMGERMITATAKIAEEAVQRSVGTHLAPLTQRLDGFQKQTEAAYFATLDRYLPAQWEDTLNNDPKLITWLQDVDPETKQLRHSLLKRAEGGLQGHLVVEILSAFLEGREIGARAAAPPKTPSVSPPEGGAVPPVAPHPDKKVYTRAEIATFFKEKRTAPEYQGEAGIAKARAIEEDIHTASREGRIRG